jgi:hypothetical protein
MRRRVTLILACLLLLAAVVGTLYWSFMPYPRWLRTEAREKTRFDPKWQIPEPEFRSARKLVAAQLGFYEFIDVVYVKSPTEVTFHTVTRWRGPLAGAGRNFKVRKKDDKWTIDEAGDWWS